MKKIFALVLALIMMTAICVPAFAAEETANVSTEGDVSVTVSYGVGESYTVTIPADIDFGGRLAPGATNITAPNQQVKANNVYIEAGRELVVTIKSLNGYNLVCGEESFAYTVTPVKVDDVDVETPTAFSGTNTAQEIFSLDHNEHSVIVDLAFAVAEGPTVAGSYTDTLTFTTAVNTVSEGE